VGVRLRLNLISTVRRLSRNVKRWRGGAMIHRWFGLGMLQAADRFRRIKVYRELNKLSAALAADHCTDRAA
jgi:hypothetical protein